MNLEWTQGPTENEVSPGQNFQAEAHRLAVEQWKSIPRNTDGKDKFYGYVYGLCMVTSAAWAVGI